MGKSYYNKSEIQFTIVMEFHLTTLNIFALTLKQGVVIQYYSNTYSTILYVTPVALKEGPD